MACTTGKGLTFDDVLLLDVAHAHSGLIIEKLNELKKNFRIDVMIGTIATAEAAKALIEVGANGLEVGIGTSSICTTIANALNNRKSYCEISVV